jgi:hypothetical protein
MGRKWSGRRKLDPDTYVGSPTVSDRQCGGSSQLPQAGHRRNLTTAAIAHAPAQTRLSGCTCAEMVPPATCTSLWVRRRLPDHLAGKAASTTESSFARSAAQVKPDRTSVSPRRTYDWTFAHVAQQDIRQLAWHLAIRNAATQPGAQLLLPGAEHMDVRSWAAREPAFPVLTASFHGACGSFVAGG